MQNKLSIEDRETLRQALNEASKVLDNVPSNILVLEHKGADKLFERAKAIVSNVDVYAPSNS